MENPFEEQRIRPQRPTFLTVLCILTFIGSGWKVLSNLFSLFMANSANSNLQMEQYSNMVGQMDNGDMSSLMSDFMSSSMEVLQVTAVHAFEIAAINLVLALLSLLGAVLMFHLRRSGFYLYVTAQILFLFVLPYFAGFSMLIVLGMAWSAFISLIFIIMYALNVKYMR